MGEVLRALCKPLPGDVRQLVQHNVDTMMRGLKFRFEKQDAQLQLALNRGWQRESLEALIEVVSFYHVVIGPIKSSSVHRPKPSGAIPFGSDIQYGSKLHFDSKLAAECRALADHFEMLTEELGIKFWWLQVAHVDDLIYKLAMGDKDENGAP